MSKNVFLEYLNDYSMEYLNSAIEKGFQYLNLNNVFSPKMTVLLKVNLPEAISQDNAESTHPNVVRALVDYLNKLGVKCIVADCPEKKFSKEFLSSVYLNTGMLEVANLTNCELNQNLATQKMEISNGVKTKAIRMLKLMDEVDVIINVGKLKFDEKLGYLGATSNVFGVVPGEVKNLILNRLTSLSDFNNLIIDIYEKLNRIDVLEVQELIQGLNLNDCTVVVKLR